MPGLLTLPAELVVEISRYLEPVALSNFRLSCKGINHYVQAEADYQFSKQDHKVIIEHRRLETLVTIAKHPRMRLLIRHLNIANHALSRATARRTDRRGDGTDFRGSPFEGYMMRDVLKTSGQARYLLAEAFRHLENLKSISISNQVHYIDSLCDLSSTRDMEQSEEPRAMAQLIMPIVLLALADACARPDEINIYSSRSYRLGECLTVPLHTFAIPPRSGLSDVLNNLISLHLQLKLAEEDFDSWRNPQVLRRNGAPLRRFVSHLTSLTTLQLTFQAGEPMAESLLAWLSCTHNEELGAGLGKLRSFHIRSSTTSVDVLVAVCLRFHHTRLELTGPVIVPELVVKDRLTSWRLFLQDLSKGLVLCGNSMEFFGISLPYVRQLFDYAPYPTHLLERPRIGTYEIGFRDSKVRHGPPQTSICYKIEDEPETIDQWLMRMAGLVFAEGFEQARGTF